MHFAIQLAKQGNNVYFVNTPTDINTYRKINVDNNPLICITVIDLKKIRWNLFFRHKLFNLYKQLSKRYVKIIQQIIGGKINEVWCFDPHVYVDLKLFNSDKTILMLYDFYKGQHVFKAAKSADAIISISQLILDYYQNTFAPKLLLQHGLGEQFTHIAIKNFKDLDKNIFYRDKIRIGYMGNLLRAINVNLAKEIIEQHTDKEFHFWGPYSLTDNNVTSKNIIIEKEFTYFIEFLKNQKNVFLHGIKEQKILAIELNKMDAFLFLYSANSDMNQASNSHKILEYLSTGKVTVSTYVSNYTKSNLLVMSKPNRDKDLPELFHKVINNLPFYNSANERKKRILFALDNTYVRQIEKIRNFIY